MDRTHYDRRHGSDYYKYGHIYDHEENLRREGVVDYNDNPNKHQTSRHHLGGRYAHHYDEYSAAKGFHGIVRKPTHFLAGEAGPERVNITPLKHNKSTTNRSKPSKHFNVFSVGKKYKHIF